MKGMVSTVSITLSENLGYRSIVGIPVLKCVKYGKYSYTYVV